MLQRVRKADIKVDSWYRPDGVDYCLDCWKRWMHGDPDRDLGAKTMKLMGESDGYGGNSDDAQQANANRIGAATDAMVDSLSRLHIWAVYKANSIGQVWRFDNADLAATYSDAKLSLEEKLKKNVCTSVLF